MTDPTPIPITEISEEEALLFPSKPVTLTGGQIVIVKPWGMATGRVLAPRVAALLQKTDTVPTNAASLVTLVRDSQEEVCEIIRLTLGWSKEDMDSDDLYYEDIFTLAQAVLEVCILRPDGGGVAGKALALLVHRGSATAQSAPSTPPQSDGSEDAT